MNGKWQMEWNEVTSDYSIYIYIYIYISVRNAIYESNSFIHSLP